MGTAQEEPDILCTRLLWLAYANPRSTRPAGNWHAPIMLPKSFLHSAQKLLCSDMKNKRGASFFRNLRLIRLATMNWARQRPPKNALLKLNEADGQSAKWIRSFPKHPLFGHSPLSCERTSQNKRSRTSFRISGSIRLATTYSRTTAGSYYHRRLRA